MTRSLLIVLALQFLCHSAFARPEILDEWEIRYPSAADTLRNCQLCHEQPDIGGNGWNTYGWAIRTLRILLGSTSEAIAEAEFSDADGDSGGRSNVDEIESGTQPGWRTDLGNTIRYKPGTLPAKSILASDAILKERRLCTLDEPVPPLPEDPGPIARKIPIGADASTEIIATGAFGLASENMVLTSPVTATYAPGLSNFLFVADQIGKIYKVDLSDIASSVEFLDLSTYLPVLNGNYDERGLLGFTFHPNFAENGQFYTHHSEPAGTETADFPLVGADHQTVISEWRADNFDNNSALGMFGSKADLLRIDQPAGNHNGGALLFNQDGTLLITLGDGGGQNDEFGNGDNPATPLGSILRILPNGDGTYSIPVDNPFVNDASKLDQLYAYGLRNPFSMTIDRNTGKIYAGDVGQRTIEEVNLIESGKHYGWNVQEGTYCFHTTSGGLGFVGSQLAEQTGSEFLNPILEYDHDEGISVIAGPVYRGAALSSLRGSYLFGDFVNHTAGRIFRSSDFNHIEEIRIDGSQGLGMFLSGFGEDSLGEVYLLGKSTFRPSGSTGTIKKITSFTPSDMCFPIRAANGKLAIICI